METLFKQDNLELFEATEPSDYVRMFQVPCASCMVLSPKGWYSMDMWHAMIERHNIYPASWYHFTPHSRGVWLEHNGSPIARCMIYRTKDMFVYYDDIKYANYGSARIIHMIMQHLGYRQSFKLWAIPSSFEVPGYELDGEMYCPLPHCDNQKKDFSVLYEPEDNVFIFYPNKDAPKDAFSIHSTYDFNGYLSATAVMAGMPVSKLIKKAKKLMRAAA